MTARHKRYTLFCGIDVGKDSHTARIIDADGRTVAKPRSFPNSAVGYAHLLERLDHAGQRNRILIAMEATGHYWYGLHDFLTRRQYAVAVLNPIQTSAEAHKGIRKQKTDSIDTGHIVAVIKNGQHRPAHIPGELAMTCRQLARLRHALRRQRSRIKQLIRSRLHPVWPEFETFFANPFCGTALSLLTEAPTPEDLLALPIETLAERLRKASRGKFNTEKAHAIRQATETSVGMKRGLPGSRIAIGVLIAQLQALAPVHQQLEMRIEELAQHVPAYLMTLPGGNPLRAVALFGEIDPVETFAEPKQLVAFAGLDVAVFQSGKPDAVYRRISKRGSPLLRQTLWTMAHLAIRHEGELRDYYLRRRRQGLHHLAATTAVAVKLTRIVWRIMTDQRDYVPDHRSCPS